MAEGISEERLAYSVAEYSELTGLSQSTIRREIKAGRLGAIKRRSCVVIPRTAGLAYLDMADGQRPASPPPAA